MELESVKKPKRRLLLKINREHYAEPVNTAETAEQGEASRKWIGPINHKAHEIVRADGH